MQYLQHTIRVMSIAVALLMTTSCNDWLSVSPKSQVEDTDLFSAESGYKEALAGVYSAMVSDNTYTKNMLFGAIDVLGQLWDNTPSGYDDMALYDYTATTSESLFSAIWSSNYNAIANANNILSHIDDDQSIFTRSNYSIIKGETLALRAFLHFDLLRCFGVSFAQNPSMPSIPYVTELTYKVFPQLTVSEVANKVLADLVEAQSLLVDDPILTGEEITEMIDFGYLINREVHLNYYAVTALLARVYMWMGEYQKALTCAQTVLDSGAFEWSTSDNMMRGYDYAFITEQIFGLNNINLSYMSDYYFNSETQSACFSISPDRLNSIYDPTDYRFLYQFSASVTGEWECLMKYNESKSDDSYYTNKIPLIRLAEMQLIVAECNYRLSGSGLAALNELRELRGVTPYTEAPSDFLQELIYEYRREFVGEGQLFFFYKRLNWPSVSGASNDMIGEKAYTFPIPKSETEASTREDNR